jgi:hypothetical protein
VLLGEDRGRRQHHDLLAGVGRLERGAQGHLGLAEADVAADQPVHRPLGLHVALDLLDGFALVGGLLEGEGGLEVAQPVGVRREGEALAAPALRVQVEQLAGQLLRGAPRPRLDLVPAGPAELGQPGVRAARPDLISASDEDVRQALAALETEKAVYEVHYELNNRPDWLWLPLSQLVRMA